MNELATTPIEGISATPELVAQIRDILKEAKDPLPFTKVKTAVNKLYPKGKGKSPKPTEEEITDALIKSHAHTHSPKAKRGKAAYWSKSPQDYARIVLERKIAKIPGIVNEKVAKLANETVTLADLGKPKPALGKEAQLAFSETISELVRSGSLYTYPGKRYGRNKPAWHQTETNAKQIKSMLGAAKKLLEREPNVGVELLRLLAHELKIKLLSDAHEPSPFRDTEFNVADFAKRVHQIAASTGTDARPYGNKVFISAAWRASQVDEVFPRMSLETFKKHLVDANGKGLLSLSQANEVQMMNPQQIRDSEIVHFGAPFHFIRLEGDNT